jgi:hypothetical protein
MDCSDVRAALVEGPPHSPELAAHALGCEVCAELLADDAALARGLVDQMPGAAVPAGLAEAMQRRLADEPAPGSALRRTATWGVGVLVMAVWAGVRHRPDLADVNGAVVVALLIGFAAAVGGALRVASRPPYKPPLRPVAVALVVAGVLLMGVLPGCVPVAQPGVMPNWTVATAMCFGVGSAITGALAGLWWALERRTVVGSRWPLAFVLGAAVANAVMLVHCPYSDAAHVWTAHSSLGLVWAGVAWGVVQLRRLR